MEGVKALVGQLLNADCGSEARGGRVVWRGVLRVVVSCLQEVRVPPVALVQGRGGGREVRVGRGLGQEVER